MGKKKTDFEAIERVCERTSSLLAPIEELLLPWAMEREKLLAAWMGLIRRKRKIAERFPEQWHSLTAMQVAAGQVLAFPARTRRFLRAHGEELSAEEAALVRRFEEAPWFYSPFLIREKLERGFFAIEDLDDGEERLLYSPAVRDMERTGVRLFLSLLFDNGRCLQTYGPVHYYRGYRPFDFHYFARLLLPGTWRAEGLSAAIAADPGSFLLLDVATEVPLFGHRGEPMEVCDQEVRLAGFDPQKLAGAGLQLRSAGAVQRLSLEGEDNPFRQAFLFYDRGKKRMLVHASNMRLYGRLREILAEEVPLPAEPEWHASINMVLAARQILGKEEPSAAYIALFEPQEEPQPEKAKELARMNAFLAELGERRNEGVAYSLEELAGRHGVAPEAARQMEEAFRKQADAVGELRPPIEGGLEGYRPPPPAVRRQFYLSPWDNSVFLFLDNRRVRELYASILPVLEQRAAERRAQGVEAEPPPRSLDALPDWLEDLYSDVAEEKDYTLLNASLHLLCSRGEELEPARGYAAEVLRLFGQVYTPGGEPRQVERFIRRYARFCDNVLCAGGLAEAEPGLSPGAVRRGDFRLRPSPFLRAWAELRRRP